MSEISVRLWQEVENQPAARNDIDEIFYGASLTKTFESEHQRAAFHDRWLGRYLTHYPDWFYVAQSDDGAAGTSRINGYLAGCIDDPRDVLHFSDIPYFQTFETHLDLYPAHLHINLAPEFRSAGLGKRLVARFLKDAANAGRPGAHVVTGARSRNVSFYTRCGFNLIATARTNAIENVFLGIRL